MPAAKTAEGVVTEIAKAEHWNEKVSLIRKIPENFGTARHQEVYAAIAEAIYVPQLAPDFAYVHWRSEYELARLQVAYELAFNLTMGFSQVSAGRLAETLQTQPTTLLIFRLLLGFTAQEFAASTIITAAQLKEKPLSISAVKAIEGGRTMKKPVARVAAAVIDQTMRKVLFTGQAGGTRSKIDKPDTAHGWQSVNNMRPKGCPLRCSCISVSTVGPSASSLTQRQESEATFLSRQSRNSLKTRRFLS